MSNVRVKWPLVPILCFAVLISGCGELEVIDAEPKRADDAITAAELDSFLLIVESLAEHKLPPMPTILLPAPQWSRNRSLPVIDLVKEDEKARIEHSSIDWLAGHCPQSRFLKRALRRERMTVEQFVGLYLALGLSLSRDHVPEDCDLEKIVIRGKQAIAELKKEHQIFSSLTDDQACFLQEESGWLAAVDRAARLKIVHPANLALVQKNRDRLAAVMPAEFLLNPLKEFTTVLEDRGIPFQEPAGGESDDHIEWSRDQAIVGSNDESR